MDSAAASGYSRIMHSHRHAFTAFNPLVREGLVLVNAMHITASVYINDDEQGLLKDYEAFLERLAPQSGTYKHNETGEDNADADEVAAQTIEKRVLPPSQAEQLPAGRGDDPGTGPRTRQMPILKYCVHRPSGGIH